MYVMHKNNKYGTKSLSDSGYVLVTLYERVVSFPNLRFVAMVESNALPCPVFFEVTVIRTVEKREGMVSSWLHVRSEHSNPRLG
jgi:hypothetical protein